MITVDLVNPLFYHIRQKERSIGIDFDSEQVKALYGLLEDLHIEQVAKKGMRVSLISSLEDCREKLRGQKDNLNNARELIKSIELAAAMIEALNG